MPITIRTCTAADGPAVGVTNTAAYWENGNWRLIWGTKTLEYVTEQSSKRQSTNLLGDREHRRVEVAIDEETGRLVGYARWALPDRLVSEWLECQVPAVSKEEEKQYAARHAGADWQHRRELDVLDVPVSAMKNRLQGQHEYMELEFLAVHPEFKGQGIASRLVQRGTAKAREMNVRVFVMAFKAAVGLYQRAGFQMLDQIVQDDSKFGGPGDYAIYFLEWVPPAGEE
ncbi:acyl-CoA N-acyltransferase [Microdochium trichocladiopsis]|uniref:Acyl-CoA N-acyltransferase n=1 Tax=Microdochium trichocladiopsis TaxID=1682393 RepID=A0A9P8YLM3_9PEZI|nr:acyl-CoA N-acyltransferase [Microdochium trichocladiopsis]KAH7041274.1 acyl-CoA N-acyltransferase [Microdochium trichocladiopsis]